MDISKIIGESSEYDKKQSLETKRPKSWCKSVSAFANSFGGKLIFGIADNDAVIGLENAQNDAEAMSEIIKTHLNPIPEFSFRLKPCFAFAGRACFYHPQHSESVEKDRNKQDRNA